MRNLLLFIVIVMLLLPNSIGISQEITYPKYLTATITSSYVPLFVVGFVTTVAGLYKHEFTLKSPKRLREMIIYSFPPT